MPCSITPEEDAYYRRETRKKKGLEPNPNLPWEIIDTGNGKTLVACKTRYVARDLCNFLNRGSLTYSFKVIKCPC
jgi:hypothetical protein